MHTRYVTQNSGMHLEAVCRMFLETIKHLSTIRFNGTTLGKAVHLIEKAEFIDIKIIDELYSFVAIYNKSKHEVNNDENRLRMF